MTTFKSLENATAPSWMHYRVVREKGGRDLGLAAPTGWRGQALVYFPGHVMMRAISTKLLERVGVRDRGGPVYTDILYRLMRAEQREQKAMAYLAKCREETARFKRELEVAGSTRVVTV